MFLTGEALVRSGHNSSVSLKPQKIHNFDSIRTSGPTKDTKAPTFSKMVRAMFKWCNEHNVSPGYRSVY